MDETTEIIYNSKLEEIEIALQRLSSARKYAEECQEYWKRLLNHAHWLKSYGWEITLKMQQGMSLKQAQSKDTSSIFCVKKGCGKEFRRVENGGIFTCGKSKIGDDKIYCKECEDKK